MILYPFPKLFENVHAHRHRWLGRANVDVIAIGMVASGALLLCAVVGRSGTPIRPWFLGAALAISIASGGLAAAGVDGRAWAALVAVLAIAAGGVAALATTASHSRRRRYSPSTPMVMAPASASRARVSSNQIEAARPLAAERPVMLTGTSFDHIDALPLPVFEDEGPMEFRPSTSVSRQGSA